MRDTEWRGGSGLFAPLLWPGAFARLLRYAFARLLRYDGALLVLAPVPGRRPFAGFLIRSVSRANVTGQDDNHALGTVTSRSVESLGEGHDGS